MSKSVSIAEPEEMAGGSSARTSKSPTASPPKSPRASTESPPETQEKAADETTTKATSDSALIKSNTEGEEGDKEAFSDDCERYQKDCCCCHCVAVRCALKRAAFLRTPEGKKRLEMKLHMRSFFMDINALTYARCRIENQLDGSKSSLPSSRDGYPISITKVKRIDSKCLSVDWFIHDVDYVDHYEIFVDNRRHKSVFNPRLTCAILLDVNARTSHKILMRALPRKLSGSSPNPIDQLVCDVCCGRMDRVLKGDYFCQCAQQTEMQRIQQKYKQNNCQTLVDFWKPSEFLYTPVCSCPGNCDCDCFV